MVGRSVNGFGTRIYGERDFLPDGSFVTTKWVIFLWIPILPLSSMRVRCVQRRLDHLPASVFLALGGLLAFRSSAKYVVLSKCRPVLRQVLYTYAYILALGLACWKQGSHPGMYAAIIFLLLYVPSILREVAESRAERARAERALKAIEERGQPTPIVEK